MLGGDGLQALAEEAAALDHLRQEAFGQHDVEHRVGDRAGQGIAAEGGAMRAGDHARRGAGRGEAGADREAAAQTLGDGGDVRAHIRLLAGEQRARAAHAGLDLVEHEQQTLIVAEATQVLQEPGRRRPDAALALDRFDQDRRRLGSDCGAQRLIVAERDDVEAGQQRLEAFDSFLLPAAAEIPAIVRPWNAPWKVTMR